MMNNPSLEVMTKLIGSYLTKRGNYFGNFDIHDEEKSPLFAKKSDTGESGLFLRFLLHNSNSPSHLQFGIQRDLMIINGYFPSALIVEPSLYEKINRVKDKLDNSFEVFYGRIVLNKQLNGIFYRFFQYLPREEDFEAWFDKVMTSCMFDMESFYQELISEDVPPILN